MRHTIFHPRGWHSPHRFFQVKLIPGGQPTLATAYTGQRQENDATLHRPPSVAVSDDAQRITQLARRKGPVMLSGLHLTKRISMFSTCRVRSTVALCNRPLHDCRQDTEYLQCLFVVLMPQKLNRPECVCRRNVSDRFVPYWLVTILRYEPPHHRLGVGPSRRAYGYHLIEKLGDLRNLSLRLSYVLTLGDTYGVFPRLLPGHGEANERVGAQSALGQLATNPQALRPRLAPPSVGHWLDEKAQSKAAAAVAVAPLMRDIFDECSRQSHRMFLGHSYHSSYHF